MPAANAYGTIGGRSESRALPCFFALFCVFVFVRFILNGNILDKVINYSADGGAIVEKIHPGTYGILGVLTATLLSTRIELQSWELRALRGLTAFAAVIVMIAVFTLLLGHGGSAGYLVDSYLAACAGGAAMLFFPPPWREWLGNALLVLIAAGALVALGEVATQARLLPYPFRELSFRPTGLSGHPLELGLFNAVGINFVAASRWPAAAKAGMITIMLLGAIASGARVASIVAALSALSVIVLYQSPQTSPETRFRMKALLLLGSALAVPAALGILLQLGLLERFQNGLFDESALARVNIYGLFDLVSWNDILFGTDLAYIRNLALQHFDLEYIESSIIMFIFQFGLIGMLVFLLALALTFVALVRGAGRHVLIGTVAFFAVAGGNNALSTKTPIVLMIVLLIVAFHARPSAMAR